MTPGLFVELPEGDVEGRDLDSMEEDPELAFKVDALMLLGVLYCRTAPRIRIKKFYSMLQPGLDDQISACDLDIERLLPLMGFICYKAIISQYNQEHREAGNHMQCKDEWLPEEDMELVDEACKSIYDEEDIGFLDVVFGVQSRKDQEDFNQDLFDHHYRFL